jgi:hypothetical protein
LGWKWLFSLVATFSLVAYLGVWLCGIVLAEGKRSPPIDPPVFLCREPALAPEQSSSEAPVFQR